MDTKQKMMLAGLSSVPFVMVLGNSMLIPILPSMQRALDLTPLQASLVITMFSVPAGLMIPLSGFLSDYFTRRVVIIPALILYGTGGLIAGGAALIGAGPTYAIIIGGRILQGIGAAGTAPIAMALTGDLFKGQERGPALGVIEAANGFGKVVSPVLGAAVGLIIWFAPFFVFPGLTALSAAAVWLAVREPKKEKEPQPPAQYFQSILQVFEKKTSLFLSAFLAGSLALFVLFGILFFLSEHLEERFHLSLIIKGLLLAIPVLFMSVTSFITGAVIKRKVKLMKFLTVTGLGLMAAALVVMPLSDNTYLFFTAISFIGIGVGLILPCLTTLITSSVDPARRGLVTSLYGGVRFFGVAAGPAAFALLLDLGMRPMSWIVAGGAIAAGVVFLIFVRTKLLQQSPDPA
ncbi:MFS transporter [Candidatus Desulforudis audaxviator]|uniref:Major facilitator superfamily MFS_1 n=1 Tax=Desulforudis audaxviator (strain MP104C) TaxID=477974 RepID=B1I4G6_DESAP|nr:MFS transporter [Candidatus Desulforudis audaxviator]ACA59819.1 major facilitator superfamily MFS_1 [Candidatus Desulforudis audaxviator MP104C]AZK59822.1 major facilitator superfamily MFS_1 [Candidatus Desulforudis audaxviator]